MCGCIGEHNSKESDLQYAAKLVCGEVKTGGPVAPGRYWTAINVHNPSRCHSVRLLWKVAVGAALNDRERIVTRFREVTLGPDEAIEIDCPDAFMWLKEHRFAKPFVKGWIVVESEFPLDVVAVYTSAFEKEPARTFHTERVPARCVGKCHDCTINLTTGSARWETIGFTATTTPNAAWTTIPGATWLCAPDGVEDAQYRLCFDLCTHFVPNPLTVICASDDEGTLSVNGQVINTAPFGFPSSSSVVIPPHVWHAGRNCLTVNVRNTGGGPIGFCMSGVFDVQNGCCG